MCDKYVFSSFFPFIRLANAYVERTFYAWPFEKCFYGMKIEFPQHLTYTLHWTLAVLVYAFIGIRNEN